MHLQFRFLWVLKVGNQYLTKVFYIFNGIIFYSSNCNMEVAHLILPSQVLSMNCVSIYFEDMAIFKILMASVIILLPSSKNNKCIFNFYQFPLLCFQQASMHLYLCTMIRDTIPESFLTSIKEGSLGQTMKILFEIFQIGTLET